MTKSIRLKSSGTIENFEIIKSELPNLEDNDILISHEYIAINRDDVLIRKGNKHVEFPIILGTEALGVIEKIGSKVEEKGIVEGNRVIYATAPIGAYTDKRVVNFKYCAVVPTDIDTEILIGCFSKAMTAHYLLRRVVRLRTSQTIVVHGAAGAVGHIMCQMASFHGIRVIGTVKSKEQVEFALSNGCLDVIDNSSQDFVSEVMRLTDEVGVDAVYDFVGGTLIPRSIACLNFLGILVSCGDLAGKPPLIDISALDKRCAFVTRPRLEVYRFPRMEFVIAAEDVFELIRQGAIKPYINKYNFNEIPKIHKDIEQDHLLGSFIAKC